MWFCFTKFCSNFCSIFSPYAAEPANVDVSPMYGNGSHRKEANARTSKSLLKLDEKRQTNCGNKAEQGAPLTIRRSRVPNCVTSNVERMTNLRSNWQCRWRRKNLIGGNVGEPCVRYIYQHIHVHRAYFSACQRLVNI